MVTIETRGIIFPPFPREAGRAAPEENHGGYKVGSDEAPFGRDGREQDVPHQHEAHEGEQGQERFPAADLY
jgi:hypothetical protein